MVAGSSAQSLIVQHLLTSDVDELAFDEIAQGILKPGAHLAGEGEAGLCRECLTASGAVNLPLGLPTVALDGCRIRPTAS